MALLTANGVKLNVMRLAPAAPQAPPVVLLHGIVIDNLSSLYYTLANHFASTHDVVLYDQRGHGRSERPPRGYTLADSVADLSALLDGLGIDEPVALVGNSYGGTIALAFALAHPERTAGLGLVEAHFCVPGWGERMASMLRRAVVLAREGIEIEAEYRRTGVEPADRLPSLRTMGLDPFEMAFLRQWAETTSLRKLMGMARTVSGLIDETSLVDDLLEERPRGDEELRGITCPALLLYGEQSDIVERGRDLGRLLPSSELVVIPGHNHSVLMSAPERLREHLAPWLARLGTPVVPSGVPAAGTGEGAVGGGPGTAGG